MANTQKITQKMAINYVLDNFEIPEEYKAKFKDMLTAIDKKSASAKGKQAKEQKENDAKREILLTLLSMTEGKTISALAKEFAKATNAEEVPSSQKITGLIIPMCDTEKRPNPNPLVRRELVKGQNLYYLI